MKWLITIFICLLTEPVMSSCRISFVNQVSSRREAPVIYKKMKSHRKILEARGYRYVSMLSRFPGEYFLNIYFPDSRSKRFLKAELSHINGRRRILKVKNTHPGQSVKTIMKRLPACR